MLGGQLGEKRMRTEDDALSAWTENGKGKGKKRTRGNGETSVGKERNLELLQNRRAIPVSDPRPEREQKTSSLGKL